VINICGVHHQKGEMVKISCGKEVRLMQQGPHNQDKYGTVLDNTLVAPPDTSSYCIA